MTWTGRESDVERVPSAMGARDAEERAQHNRRQQAVFDVVAEEFLNPIPEDVVARTRLIILAADLCPGQAILDVGTGTGALLPDILAAHPGRVVACDLSEEMLRLASRRFAGQVTLVRADVVDLPVELGPFDRVICNAMFGNVYDQARSMLAIRRLLEPQGRLVISHPMGRQFVEQLHKSNPDLVPHGLPDAQRLAGLAFAAGLRVVSLRDEQALYIAVLEPQNLTNL